MSNASLFKPPRRGPRAGAAWKLVCDVWVPVGVPPGTVFGGAAAGVCWLYSGNHRPTPMVGLPRGGIPFGETS